MNENKGLVKGDWTREQVDLIKRTVAKDATDMELKLFLHTCQKSGLDPLRKQIYFMKVGGSVVMMAGVDGLQARANDFPDYRGTTAHAVCENDDFSFDAIKGEPAKHTFGSDRGKPIGAWARVERKNMAPFSVYVKMEDFDKGQSNWKSMPTVMIEKVARATALRRAFPEAFSGIYGPEEMDQAKGLKLIPDKEKERMRDELKKLSEEFEPEERDDIKLAALGQDRLDEICKGENFTKEDFTKMLDEIKARKGPKEKAIDVKPEPKDGLCAACGEREADSLAKDDDGNSICMTCFEKLEEARGQGTLV